MSVCAVSAILVMSPAATATRKTIDTVRGTDKVHPPHGGPKSPTTTPPTTTPPIQYGQPMPVGDIAGWHQIFAEDFNKDAALGSWGSDCVDRVVYVGATGTQWKSYPRCYLDTYQKRQYRADSVLSVHDGALDFWLHTVDGHPAGANPAPVLNPTTGSQYQTYGRYEARFRFTTPNLSDYHTEWLLWPILDSSWTCAESDFPTVNMGSSTVYAFAHHSCAGDQDWFSTGVVDVTQWHTYSEEWTPGHRRYYIDGRLFGESTTQVWSQPERWQFQTETNTTCDQHTPITCDQSGHLLVDWAVVYSYAP